MMVRADVLPEYPSVRLSEDEMVVRQMVRSKVPIRLIEQPELYTYVVHGHNSWGEAHFEGFFRDPGFRRLGVEEGREIAERLVTA
jgi:hypothetical protein